MEIFALGLENLFVLTTAAAAAILHNAFGCVAEKTLGTEGSGL